MTDTASTAVDTLVKAEETRAKERKRRNGLTTMTRKALRLPSGKIGLAMMLLVIIVAYIGPFVAPHDPAASITTPFAPPGGQTPLGADVLGRDVLSRFLSGGDVIVSLAFLAAIIGVVLGTLLGLIAGYRRGAWGSVIMRTLDIVLSFPSLLLALLFLSILGTNAVILTATVAISHVPYVARVVESSSLALTGRGFVQYAEMIGTSRWRILRREILPGIIAPLTVQLGLRITWSITTIASLAYLGFGRQAPAVDWGMMINENQSAIVTSPLSVLIPVAGIAMVAVGANLLTDALGQASGVDLSKESS